MQRNSWAKNLGKAECEYKPVAVTNEEREDMRLQIQINKTVAEVRYANDLQYILISYTLACKTSLSH